jgi:hypothetical protein
MTGKVDFSEEEWELVCEGPTTAGLVALTASRGGSFRESWAIADVYAEARKDRGDSELLDDLVAEAPKVRRYGSAEEVEQEGLRRLAEAVALLEQTAGPGRSPATSASHSTLPAGSPKRTGRPARSQPSVRPSARRSRRSRPT